MMQCSGRYLFLLLSGAFLVGLLACKDIKGDSQWKTKVIEGETMGTYYRITWLDSLERGVQPQVDSILAAINAEVSTYIPSSDISRFNLATDSFRLDADRVHFVRNFIGSIEIYDLTGGAFDPTVMPLVNYWGFGYTHKNPLQRIDSLVVDSLRQLVGLPAVQIFPSENHYLLTKARPGMSLDFSAIAKGYAVDVIGAFLQDQGLNHFLIDIGGEVLARGRNAQDLPWRIGVNTPDEEAALHDFYTILALEDRAMATSGNYRNFHETDGRKYSHTINPHTGFPEQNTLLSATVIAKDCMRADALATACMVMGLAAAKDLIQALPDAEALFIFGTDDGGMDAWHSTGMQSLHSDRL
jgi:thiamine biosynthesis lipoprotein